MKPAVQYTVWPLDLHGHRYKVSLCIENPNLTGQIISLPAWIPGSYLIRDFSKHIETIEAREIESDKSIELKKIDSDRWLLPPKLSAVEITAVIYAFDDSVRAAYLDQERGFFNPSSLCLAVAEQSHLPCSLAIAPPLFNADSPKNVQWELITTLQAVKTDSNGFGFYLAKNYDDLLDHPLAMGKFTKIEWSSCGTPHLLAIQGLSAELASQLDTLTLKTDLQKICSKTIQFFEPRQLTAPFKRYIFLLNASLNGYGGLEHRDSTALLCKRDHLPQKNKSHVKKSYEEFLGLCSHEYFHAWLVKRIQAKDFQPYALNRRAHTTLLWLFEGFTSYYDDLQLLRSNCISLERYLELVTNNWNMVLRGPGRHKQSLADSSFDAWTKYYQANENTPNAVVSYYAKGALLALGLDLVIRSYSHQHLKKRLSLDDVMRYLWVEHGKNLKGIEQLDLDKAISTIVGKGFISTWESFTKNYITGTRDLPLQNWIPQANPILSVNPKSLSALSAFKLRLGMRTTESQGWIKVTQVLDDGLAQIAGLAPGDLIASINQQRLDPARLDLVLSNALEQTELSFQFFRGDFEYHSTIPMHPKASKKIKSVAQFEIQVKTKS